MSTAANKVTIDGNEAAACVAYKASEVIAIYPITPSSAMGELSDAWSAKGKRNLWGQVPTVVEMQSEAGAAGAVHGALQGGSLATTFTSSQGLLLMIPVMYKIAGELTPAVFHVAARSIATQALSIFGDHSDVMAVRSTGWAVLFSANVQECMDMALVAHAASLESRLPFVHAFDGFRTSHEVRKIDELSEADIRAIIDDKFVDAHRKRGLTPDAPVVRGMAHNPDTMFQARETVNPYYQAAPTVVERVLERFGARTGRHYKLFEYQGAPDAERVIIIMGSGCEVAAQAAAALGAKGEKVGVLTVRLYRPFSAEHFIAALPPTVRTIAVLDRTKEPGAAGEPLYEDVVTCLAEARAASQGPKAEVRVVSGRYGLSSKDFTPAMAKTVFDEIAKDLPRNHFTIGIHDDVTGSSLPWDPDFITEDTDGVRAVFWGLGSDGTVGANKSAIKIIGDETDNYAQGHFEFDSKKAGTLTISHLRFGPRPICSPYLIQRASFIAVHQFGYIDRYDVLDNAQEGASFLLNSPYGPEEIWDKLPGVMQDQLRAKKINFYVIDAYGLARELGMGRRMNTIMQTCFFAISGVLPVEEALGHIRESIRKTYGKRGQTVVDRNLAVVDKALSQLFQVKLPENGARGPERPRVIPENAPEFVQTVTARLIAGDGNRVPVSLLPVDGTWPVGTTKWEKRGLALQVPVWDADLCIQCGKCVMVCPHAVIRAKVCEAGLLEGAPAGVNSIPASWREFPGQRYVLQVSNMDCTGCTLCSEVCPATAKVNGNGEGNGKAPAPHKALDMVPIEEQLPGTAAWDFFLNLPDITQPAPIEFGLVKNVQLAQPRFEFSGACMGCGETPYLKLLSQLFGDRALIANATGCSSIYGGNLPTTPWTTDAQGRGPAWANSLFEDNAEFGLGMRLAVDQLQGRASSLLRRLEPVLGPDLVEAILQADQSTDKGVEEQRQRVAALRDRLRQLQADMAKQAGTVDADGKIGADLLDAADYLVAKQVWIVGGDGWAYDIGYGGLDHVLASDREVKLLVLDTEVYSNTGGQASKSTPLGAVAKFASSGKRTGKKDLALMAMAYGHVYVAQVAFGANDAQFVKAFREAATFDGPSLIIAYSPCIAHGFEMERNLDQQKLAVESGHWPLFRYDPRRIAAGKNPLIMDSKMPSIPMTQYLSTEGRFRQLQELEPEVFERLALESQREALMRRRRYEAIAAAMVDGEVQATVAPVKAPAPTATA